MSSVPGKTRQAWYRDDHPPINIPLSSRAELAALQQALAAAQCTARDVWQQWVVQQRALEGGRHRPDPPPPRYPLTPGSG